MGTLFWQLNDCWPVTSWSSVDYYGRWKAFQYQAKHSFEKVMISIKEEESSYKAYIVNDDLNPFEGKFEVVLQDFNGKKLWSAKNTGVIPGSSNLVHFEIAKGDLESFDLKKTVLAVSFNAQNKAASSLFYFVKPKDLQLTNPNIQITKLDEQTYQIFSDVLAKNVFLSSEEETFFSDNYFDILPGQKVEIKLSKPVKEFRVKSLFEVMKN